jgi:hypothetical protein
MADEEVKVVVLGDSGEFFYILLGPFAPFSFFVHQKAFQTVSDLFIPRRCRKNKYYSQVYKK